jgi:hypothetical protein
MATKGREAHKHLSDVRARLHQDDSEVGAPILEAKGYDPLGSLKASAAMRWVAAVNAEGSCGRWVYRMARTPAEVPEAIRSAAEELSSE